MHHIAVDGLSALHFINTWSEIARGIIDLAVPPFLDRTLLRARSPPKVLFDHAADYSRKPPSNPSPTAANPSFETAILKLSQDKINHLKEKNKGLSTFQVVIAHVWRSACKARGLAGDQESRLYLVADGRNRLWPPLPPGFVGNVLMRTSVAATVEEILSGPLAFGAEKMNAAISRLNDEYLRSLIDLLEMEEGVRSMSDWMWALPGTDMWVVSWQGLPIYEADFGWGRPACMRRACLSGGMVYVMRNPPGEEGGLTLPVGLEAENMMNFKKVFYEDLE